MKVLLAGGYGLGNLGDEAILAALLTRLRRIKASVNVLSFSPRHTRSMHKAAAINYLNFYRVFHAILETDMLLIGGGGIFDTRIVGQTRPLLAWLHILCGYLALIMRRRLWIESVSVLTADRLTCLLLSGLLRHADRVSARDKISRRTLRQLSGRDVDLVEELSLDLQPAEKKTTDLLARSMGVDEESLKVGLALRSTGNAQTDERLTFLVEALSSWASRHSAQLVLIAFSHNRISRFENDASFLERLRTMAGDPSRVIMFTSRVHPSILESFVGRMDFLIGMRLQSLVMAYRMKIPMLALAYHPKIKAFAESVGVNVIEPNDLDCAFVQNLIQRLCQLHDSIMQEDLEQLSRS